MSCPFSTPNGAVEAVRQCVEDGYALNGHGFVYPTRVLVGASGASDGYTCCPGGYLSVEWSEVKRDNRGGADTEFNCQDAWVMKVQVEVSRCSAVFKPGAGGNTDGGSPEPAIRNQESLNISAEAFLVFEQLRCCAIEEWDLCGAYVEGVGVRKDGTCWIFTVDLLFELDLCCPPQGTT